MISIDGTTGEVFLGEVPVTDSRSSAGSRATRPTTDELVAAVARLMEHADRATPAGRARQRRHPRGRRPGPPVRRPGHRAVPHRAHVPRRAPAARRAPDRRRRRGRPGGRRSPRCCRCSAQDFIEILEAMDGLPVTIRLIDPPLHEFLPDFTELSVAVALADDARHRKKREHKLLEAVQRLHEENPMLGLRGVRLGIVIPGPVRDADPGDPRGGRGPAQGRRRPAAGDHDPAGRDRARARPGPADVDRWPREVQREHGPRDPAPGRHHDRAAARRDDRGRDRRVGGVLLLRHQRPHPDDVGVLPRRRRGVVLLDVPGARASSRSRRSSRSTSRASGRSCGRRSSGAGRPAPTCTSGVCGEHGGDPDSIHFFDEVGLDYVSCSPFRVPVARLEAGRSGAGPSDSA